MLRKNKNAPEEQAVCCVCHNGDEKEDFVVACKCSGSMKYHEDCIKKSIIQRKTIKCPNCETDYYGAFVNNLKDFATGYVVNLRRLQGNPHVDSDTHKNTTFVPYYYMSPEMPRRWYVIPLRSRPRRDWIIDLGFCFFLTTILVMLIFLLFAEIRRLKLQTLG